MEYRWTINLTGTLPDGHTPDLTITRLTSEIIEPEEEMTPEECLVDFKKHITESLELKKKVEFYHENLLTKAQESNVLIESLLNSQVQG